MNSQTDDSEFQTLQQNMYQNILKQETLVCSNISYNGNEIENDLMKRGGPIFSNGGRQDQDLNSSPIQGMNVSDFGKGLKDTIQDQSRNDDEKGNTMGADGKSIATYFSLQTNEVTERDRNSKDFEANQFSNQLADRKIPTFDQKFSPGLTESEMKTGYGFPPKSVSPINQQVQPASIKNTQHEINQHILQQREYNEMLDQVHQLQQKLSQGNDSQELFEEAQNEPTERDMLIQHLGNQYMAEAGKNSPQKSQSPSKSRGSMKLNEYSKEYSHDTGHFNSHSRADRDSRPIDHVIEYSDSELIEKRLNFTRNVQSQPMIQRSKSQESREASRGRSKSIKSGKQLSRYSGASTQSNGKKDSANIPSSIHSTVEEKRASTTFASKFQRLYDNIAILYPHFQEQTQSITQISPDFGLSSTLSAPQMFNQLNFMLQRIIEEKQQSDKDIETLMADQGALANTQLKLKLENKDQEVDYYKKQIETYKDQLQIKIFNENEIESKFVDQIKGMNESIQQYKMKVANMQQRLIEVDQFKIQELNLQKRLRELEEVNSKLINEKSGWQDLKGDLSFRESGNRREVQVEVVNDSIRCLEQENMKLKKELYEAKPSVKRAEQELGLEKDLNRNLNEKLSKITQQFDTELSDHTTVNAQLRLEIQERDEQIRLQVEQFEENMLSQIVEFPLVVKYEQIPQPQLQLNKSSINLSNQNQPKLVSMTGGHQLSQDQYYDPLGEFFKESPFGGADDIEEINKRYQPLRGKSNGAKTKAGKKKVGPTTMDGQAVSMMNFSSLIQAQISTTSLADQIISDQKEDRQKRIDRFDEHVSMFHKIDQKVDSFHTENKDFNERQVVLTKENEDLKLKFSTLLDQFQEFVNESERRLEEQQDYQKLGQEKILGELNNNIKDLELMSQNLQQECMDKDLAIERLQAEKSTVETDNMALKQQAQLHEGHLEGMSKVKIQSLSEEIEYLKKHYLNEIETLRQENKFIRHRQFKMNSQGLNETFENDEKMNTSGQGQSPYQNSQGLNSVKQASLFGRQIDQDLDNYPVSGMNKGSENQFLRRHTPDQRQFDGFTQHEYNNRSKSQDRAMGSGRTNSKVVNLGHNHRDQIDNRSYNSRSQDRQDNMNHSYERYSNNQQQHSDHLSQERPMDQPSHAKNILQGTQNTFDNLKRDIVDKDRQIDSKNREIVKLRMLNEELMSNFENNHSLNVSQQQRLQVLKELDNVYESLKIELERIKINLFKNGQPGGAVKMGSKYGNESQPVGDGIISCEEKMIQMIRDKICQCRNLVQITSEIYLLSQKRPQGQMPESLGSQNQEMVKLMHDNALLQRNIYEYEKNLSDLNNIFSRDDPKDSVIFELKKLTDTQLQEIVKLQQDIDTMQRSVNQDQKKEQEIQSLKQEIQMVQDRMQNIQDGNTELVKQRRALMEKVGNHQRDTEVALQSQKDVEIKYKEASKQLEELRQRITTIAELFEKKSIKQKYSFEVLCDFIHDKAKRLFQKYDTAVKEKKSGQEDVKQYYKSKMNQIEKQNDQHKDMINQLKNQNAQNKSRINELQGILDQCSVRGQYNQVPNTQNSFNGSYYQQHSNPKIPTLDQSNQQQEIEMMRQEKNQLNQKINEFQQVMQEFQINQKQSKEENSILKNKIQMLEDKNNHQKPMKMPLMSNRTSFDAGTATRNMQQQLKANMNMMASAHSDSKQDPSTYTHLANAEGNIEEINGASSAQMGMLTPTEAINQYDLVSEQIQQQESQQFGR